VSGSPGSRRDLDFVLRFGSSTLALILLSYFNLLLPIIQTNRPLQRILALKALVDLCPHIYEVSCVLSSHTSFEFDTKSSTTYGHPNAAQAAGVVSAYYSDTPAFGISPPRIESDYSVGARRGLKFATNTDSLALMVELPRFLPSRR
jgi:hypothetical protein